MSSFESYWKEYWTEERKARRQAVVDALQPRVNALKEAGAPFFMGAPDAWYEKPGPKFRCCNDHVSSAYLKSDAVSGHLCFECMEPVCLSFPEDSDGPLEKVRSTLEPQTL